MNEKYNVLFMRDDQQVRRYRIGPSLLRFLIWTPALLVLIAAGGLWAGYTYWERNDSLLTERVQLQQQLGDMQIQLERLENVQQILQSNDPEELQALFGTMSIDASSDERPAVDLASLLHRVDSRKVQVNNITLKDANNNMYRLTFDLNNVDTKNPVGGRITLAFITRDGQQLPIEADADALKFYISRFKKIVSSFTQPESLSQTDLYGLQVVITSKGKTLLQAIYPVQEIAK